MSLSLEQLNSYFEDCRRRLVELRSRSDYLPLYVSILMVEGAGSSFYDSPDPFAPILAGRPYWFSQSFSQQEQFAIAFYADDPSLTEERKTAAFRTVEKTTDEPRRLLASLPDSIKAERLALPDFVRSHSAIPTCSNWWRAVFHLAWHFPRPFLTACRERILKGQFGGRHEETFVQINGTGGRDDLLSGMIYSGLKDDLCLSSEAAIAVVIDALKSIPATTGPKAPNRQVITSELQLRFRDLRSKFEQYTACPHPMETSMKLMKLADSFTTPPAATWAYPWRGGCQAKPEIRLSRLDADQEVCEIQGPATNWFCGLAEEAGNALPDWIVDCPIMFDMFHRNETGFRARIGTVHPVMNRGSLERWIGFVFSVLKEREHEALSIRWMTNGGPLGHGLATLKVDPFRASVLAIDLMGLGQPVPNQMNNEIFQDFRESLAKERQQHVDIANESARRKRLRDTLCLLTHPPGSENLENPQPELWTPGAWADRFVELAKVLTEDGISSIALPTEMSANLPLPHRCALEIWNLAFSGDCLKLQERVAELQKDETGYGRFSLALLDFNDWFSGYAEWGDCFYDLTPRPPLDSPEALLREAGRLREWLKGQIRKRPDAKRWARVPDSELLLESRRKNVDAILPEIRHLWAAMHSIGGKAIPDFPVDTVETAKAEPFRTVTILEQVQEWCKEKAPSEPAKNVNPTRAKQQKRSTDRGDARTKIIAALNAHHKYDNGSCLNAEPIGNNELARLAKSAPSTANGFFNKEFGGSDRKKGYATYRVVCRDSGRLVDSLKALNDDFSPHDLYGRQPRGEGKRAEDE